jgi:hypothetical protein
MKILKYTITILILFSIISCEGINAEKEYNVRSWEIKKLELELDYLKQLHRYREVIKFKEKMSTIDSLEDKFRGGVIIKTK